MCQCFRSSNSVLRRLLKHANQQIQSVRIKSFVLLAFEREIAGSILSQNFVVSLAWEGTDTQQQDVEDESQAENVANWIVLRLHVLDVNDLRGHIAWSTASHEEILLSLCEVSQSEVSDHALPASLSAEDKVLRLQVAVHYAFSVHFLESLKNAMHDCSHFMGLEFILGLHFIVQLSPFQQLHNDVKRILRLKDFVELHAELVIEASHHLYLLYQALLPLVLAVCGFLREGLHGKVAPAFQLLSQIDRCEISLADLLLGLELLVEATLVELPLQHISASLEVGLRAQGVCGSFFLFFKGDGGRDEREGVLEVEVEEHRLAVLG